MPNMENKINKNIQLFNDDYLNVLRRMPNECVDCVITDPPYKLTGGGCCGGLHIVLNSTTKDKVKSGKLFEIPPFIVWLRECFRVMKDGTHMYCMTNDKNLKDLWTAAEQVGFKEVNLLVWKKYMHTPLPYYMKNVEYILLLRKGRARKINNMGDYTLIENIHGIRGTKIHPSQKPTELMRKFVLNSANVGEVVLDPFMGTGATGIACAETNRKFIGIEIDTNYFEVANERINKYFKCPITKKAPE